MRLLSLKPSININLNYSNRVFQARLKRSEGHADGLATSVLWRLLAPEAWIIVFFQSPKKLSKLADAVLGKFLIFNVSIQTFIFFGYAVEHLS